MLFGENGEVVKTEPGEFAGFLVERLTTDQLTLRLCAAAGCGDRAVSLLKIPGGYRPVCGRHAVIAQLLINAILGDPAPAMSAREYAERLGVDWAVVRASEPKHPTSPESFVCINCGGGYLVETQGMFAGKRYIHTCGS